MRVAVIVPTLDEARCLERRLPAARAAADELIVSDGGSTDGTVELARSLGAVVVTGSPGRGVQLNRGAACASAPLLCFLHADSSLPLGAAAAMRGAVAAGALGGGFALRFEDDRPLLRLGAILIELRTRLTRIPLGDQGQFVTRDAFTALGGFREWPILEDLDFFRRLKRLGATALLPAPVTTSGRRFLSQGILRTVATNWVIWLLYFCGVPPTRLARLYRPVR